MGYPQPNSESPVVNKSSFFRLTTTMVSDGDIYESRVGSNAVALGPESDISKLNVAYFDKSQQGNMAIAPISPQRMFVGEMYAFNGGSELYTPANTPGRILFWPSELWNPTYSPFNPFSPFGTNGRVDYITPVIDVIQYFGSPPSIAPSRNDKNYHYQNYPFFTDPVLGGANALMVPYYGRKYGYVSFSQNSIASMDLSIYGVNFAYTTTDALADVKELLAATPVPNGFFPIIPVTKVIRAAVDGVFDALMLLFNNFSTTPVQPASGPVNLRITVSDNPL